MDDLFLQMGGELRVLFNDAHFSDKEQAVQDRLEKIVGIATQIGSPLKEEAEILKMDVLNFLKDPKNPKIISIMKRHALRLKHETEEL
jgi:hypothetical protein